MAKRFGRRLRAGLGRAAHRQGKEKQESGYILLSCILRVFNGKKLIYSVSYVYTDASQTEFGNHQRSDHKPGLTRRCCSVWRSVFRVWCLALVGGRIHSSQGPESFRKRGGFFRERCWSAVGVKAFTRSSPRKLYLISGRSPAGFASARGCFARRAGPVVSKTKSYWSRTTARSP